MKKPEWFEIADSDNDEPYVSNKIPFGIFLLIGIIVSAFIFLFPSKTSETVPVPIAEIIQTPIDPIQMPTNTNNKDEDDNEDGDDD
jgi:hypothetical protein